MSFVKVDPMDKLFKDLTKLKTVPDSVWRDIGEDLVTRIKARVRLGYGCSREGDSKQKFKPLAPFTVKYREYLKSKGKLSPLTKVSMSNLTMTGDMMNQLKAKVGNGVVIGFATAFAQKKAEWNSDARPFMNLTNVELKAIKNALQDYFDGVAEGI
jgi:hypothetical protein